MTVPVDGRSDARVHQMRRTAEAPRTRSAIRVRRLRRGRRAGYAAGTVALDSRSLFPPVGYKWDTFMCLQIQGGDVMEAPNHERTADDIRADAFEAAADALENYGHDSTGGAGYNRRKAYDRGFGAAMDVLADVPLDERPDDLVSEVDELVAIVRDSDRYIDGAVEALREAAEEARPADSDEPADDDDDDGFGEPETDESEPFHAPRRTVDVVPTPDVVGHARTQARDEAILGCGAHRLPSGRNY